jgi:hypothetical protein
MGKIALLFSGHLRSLDTAIKDWKRKHPEFYDPNITDVFCHTWNGVNRTAWNNYNKDRILSCSVFDIQELIQNMNVVSYDVEDYESSPVGEITKQNNYIGTNFSIAYGTKRVYEIFREYADRTGTDYDIVIKTRVDSFLGKFPENPYGDWYQDHEKPDPLPIEYLKLKVKESEDKVMIPWFENCDHGGLTDQILIGSKNSMRDICCQYFEWLKQYAPSITNWHIETNHKRFADDCKLNIERFNYHWGIIRTGTGFTNKTNWLGFPTQ